MKMKPLNMKDIAIMDAFPFHDFEKTVLNVGCGDGKIDFYIAQRRFRVYATDVKRHETWEAKMNLTFHLSNIFVLESFPVKQAPVVICSEVLEHLQMYQVALKNLLILTEVRLIITIPYKRSFGGKNAGHCNFWDDEKVIEFMELCSPNSVAISKIRTKPDDVRRKQFCYLIVVDKRQNLC